MSSPAQAQQVAILKRKLQILKILQSFEIQKQQGLLIKGQDVSLKGRFSTEVKRQTEQQEVQLAVQQTEHKQLNDQPESKQLGEKQEISSTTAIQRAEQEKQLSDELLSLIKELTAAELSKNPKNNQSWITSTASPQPLTLQSLSGTAVQDISSLTQDSASSLLEERNRLMQQWHLRKAKRDQARKGNNTGNVTAQGNNNSATTQGAQDQESANQNTSGSQSNPNKLVITVTPAGTGAKRS